MPPNHSITNIPMLQELLESRCQKKPCHQFDESSYVRIETKLRIVSSIITYMKWLHHQHKSYVKRETVRTDRIVDTNQNKRSSYNVNSKFSNEEVHIFYSDSCFNIQ